jgi:hypothetical protein
MTQKITLNQRAGYIVINTDATGYLNLNGGTYPANAAGETVASMSVSKIVWSNVSNNAVWTIARGGNTIFTAQGENGFIDFQEEGLPLEAATGGDKSANLVFTLAGSTGRLIIKAHKRGV